MLKQILILVFGIPEDVNEAQARDQTSTLPNTLLQLSAIRRLTCFSLP
jgi:hypothetical protein